MGSPIDACPDEASRLGREYFTRLDLQVNPGLVPLDADTIAHLTGLRDLLKRRLFLRRDAIASRESSGDLPTYDRQVVQRLSALLLQLMASVFGPDLADRMVLARIGRAHDLFASGRLRRRTNPQIRVPNNVPDGAAIFFYSEFALLTIDLGIDAEAWRRLLPALVRMPALYFKVHEAHPLEQLKLPRLFDEYCEPPERVPSESDLDAYAEQLASRLDGLAPAELGLELGGLALRALCDPP